MKVNSVFLFFILFLFACKTSKPSTKIISSDEFHQKITKIDSSEFNNKDNIAIQKFPSIVGGLKAISRHLSYPKRAKENNIQGKVILQFIVTKNGSISYINVKKGLGYGCDQEALKALKSVEIEPGTINGTSVDMPSSVPVFFRL